MTEALGTHYILELYDCKPELLAHVEYIAGHMVEAANRAKASVVSHHFHQFQPYGVSGVVILEESHLTLHSWPEYGYAAVDLFFCNPIVDFHAGRVYLEQAFKAERSEFKVMQRGTSYQLSTANMKAFAVYEAPRLGPRVIAEG